MAWSIAMTALLLACGSPIGGAPPTSSLPRPTASPPATSAPTATVTPTTTPRPRAIPGIESAPLDHGSGEWVYVLNQAAAQNGESHEIWAVSADGRSSRRIARYRPPGGGPISLGRFSTDLPRQLAPDGRRLLIAAAVPSTPTSSQYAIVSLEIATGALTQLTSDRSFLDSAPAWSPDGTQIAFARIASDAREREIWLMRADGTGQRQIQARDSGSIYGFTPDGRNLCFYNAGYACLELSSGQLRRFAGDLSSGAAPGSWRTALPRFVGAFDTPARIDVADGPGVGQRTIVEVRGVEARWRPGADEFLYLSGTDLWIRPLNGDARRGAVEAVVRRAEWSRSGGAIFVVAGDAASAPPPPAPPPGSSLRRLAPDGTGVVELFRLPAERSFGLADLTTFTYP